MTTTSALVLFSGGQDSAVCLAWALRRFDRVETIGFDYRQRHSVELKCRTVFLAKLREAFPEWAATPPLRRARILAKFLRILEERTDELLRSFDAEMREYESLKQVAQGG